MSAMGRTGELGEPLRELPPVYLLVQIADINCATTLLPLFLAARQKDRVDRHDGRLRPRDAQRVACQLPPRHAQRLHDSSRPSLPTT